ncbi:Phosphotransferase enzyme family protein [Marinactinospora thermotolerans DSM 45154]|uniref:Phosphotransferase enzyme family protein n=1 Tax=Marinactinospora thermotolerans DSM 45154 TaxID=1122192 RepID=A0A1T4QE24_9ACTN|nr:phosphotransferase [Marinactinospora thermotolerans]SKA01944.1 Phosphotransferase enzyme family protein [Marinactinospora thermotolerans DSM 45154]
MTERFVADRVVSPATGEPLLLRRAWPRGTDHALVEWEQADGRRVAGQWFADPDRLERVAAATPGASALPGEGVLLQPDGADRRLPRVRALVRAGGRLVAHRPERRAVVRTDRGYVKAVRPGREAALVARFEQAERLAGTAFAVPRLLEDMGEGATLWSALPGEPLTRPAAGGRVGDWLLDWYRAGAALAVLHAAEPPSPGPGGQGGPPRHTPADEKEAVLRWLRPAWRFGLLPYADPGPVLAALGEEAGAPLRPVHRDCYDKQFVAAPEAERIGLVDLDTLALGEPAVDVANVVAHMALRSAQGVVGPARARAARAAFLAGLEPDEATLRRVPAYVAATRLRLAGVYAFRPRWRGLARELYASALESPPAPG